MGKGENGGKRERRGGEIGEKGVCPPKVNVK